MVDFAKLSAESKRKREQEMAKAPGMTINGKVQDPETTEPMKSAETATATESVTSTTVPAVIEAKGTQVAEGFFAPSEIEEMGGYGQENVTAVNVLLPRLAILQTLSPQLKKNKVEYIPGAEIGDWCELGTGDIFKGEVEVIPCHFVTQYIQWKKNRGGFAGNLGTDASCLQQTTLNEKRQNILPSGDSIVETAQWYCLLHVGSDWRRVFLPFSSTGLKVSRKWMTLARAERLLGKEGPFMPPLFYRPWKLTIAMDSNDQGDWYLPIPNRVAREKEDISAAQPDQFKTIYHLMAEANDRRRWLLEECKKFYIDARDNLVVGDMGKDDANDPDNARVVGSSSISDKSTSM
jgi:hypothetical protein